MTSRGPEEPLPGADEQTFGTSEAREELARESSRAYLAALQASSALVKSAAARVDRAPGRGPWLPKPMERSRFRSVLQIVWLLVRISPGLGPLFAFFVAVLGIGYRSPDGTSLGVVIAGTAIGAVIGIPGVVLPIYGWCTSWKRDWVAVASTLLMPASIAAMFLLGAIQQWE